MIVGLLVFDEDEIMEKIMGNELDRGDMIY